ncbi:hypothetical protein P175DRAFT_0441319 [Aspergillus ochraceoroseus IBT 24754]|uniref:Mid2 domain-containing protein n=1 Tax=Aspergillus ochraceoroseus IBT 24754 TaxID=1392256 RepID=A0A2T5LTU1_9EURO|nr:uncharacterized protein P175DRAFT_0441319 [Aspergillus ochraceoroseus IBT 24754]PTU19693.1 hypothetical protein P175DRAFT_0441319 [Aspergillus ochraceoroseus IBT 24754]
MWLLLLPVAVNAIAFPSPEATGRSNKIVESLDFPEPTAVPLSPGNAELVRRDSTISAAESSVCGFFGGSQDSRLACNYPNACVFHASDSEFPGLVGCCPTTSTSTPCIIYSTCFDNSQISATPALLSQTTNPLVMLCTYSDAKICHTRTWPALNVRDYDCTDTKWSSGETMYTAGSLTYVEIDGHYDTETISISWIGDAILRSLRDVSATVTATDTSSTSTATSTTSDATSPTPTGHQVSGHRSSTGAIVGGVVGGVGGLIVILLLGWFIWRRNKNPVQSSGHSKPDTEPIIPNDKPLELSGTDATDRYELMPEREYTELPGKDVRYELE